MHCTVAVLYNLNHIQCMCQTVMSYLVFGSSDSVCHNMSDS